MLLMRGSKPKSYGAPQITSKVATVTDTEFLVGERAAEKFPQPVAGIPTNVKQQFPIPKSVLCIKCAIAKVICVLQQPHPCWISPAMMVKHHNRRII